MARLDQPQVIGAVVVGIAVDPLDLARRPLTMMPAPDHAQDRIALPVDADRLSVLVCVPSPSPTYFHYVRPSVMPLPYLKRTFRLEVRHRSGPPVKFPVLKAERLLDHLRRQHSSSPLLISNSKYELQPSRKQGLLQVEWLFPAGFGGNFRGLQKMSHRLRPQNPQKSALFYIYL